MPTHGARWLQRSNYRPILSADVHTLWTLAAQASEMVRKMDREVREFADK